MQLWMQKQCSPQTLPVSMTLISAAVEGDLKEGRYGGG